MGPNPCTRCRSWRIRYCCPPQGCGLVLGSLNNSKARTIKVPLDFLSAGNYTAEIYTDAADAAENPNHLTKKSQTVGKADVLTIELAAGGGQVMKLTRQ